MPKTSKKKVRPTGLDRDTKESLGRIDVVASPGPRIGTPTAAMSPMGRLLTGLTDFSEAASPLLQGLAEKERAKVAAQIETDVTAGRLKSLDDLKGRPEWWTSLANGAFAQKKANEFAGRLANELDARKDVDPDALASERFGEFLETLPNDEQRLNALAILRARVPQMVEASRTAQREEAQTAIIDAAWEAARGTLQALSPDHPQYEQMLWAKRQALMRDLKSGSANFDMQAFNEQWADTLIALAIKNKSLKPIDSANLKDANGNAFITTSAGEKLFKARDSLESAFFVEDKSAIAVAQFAQMRKDDARADDWRNPFTEAEISKRVALDKSHPLYLSPSRGGSLLDAQAKVIEEQNEKVADMETLIAGGSVSDTGRLYTAVEGLVEAAGAKVGGELSPEIKSMIRTQSYAQAGAVPPQERDRMSALILSNSYDLYTQGIAELEAYMRIAPDLASDFMDGAVERRVMVSQTLRMMGVEGDAYQSIMSGGHSNDISEARRGITKIAAGRSGDWLRHAMKNAFVYDPVFGSDRIPPNYDEIEGRVFDIAAVLRGSGITGDDRAAVAQAIKTVKYFMVPAGGRPGGQLIFPSQAPIGFGSEDVHDNYRETILKAEARRLGLDPGEADEWSLTTDPSNVSKVRIISGTGVLLGVLNWDRAARRYITSREERDEKAVEAYEAATKDVARTAVEQHRARKANPNAPIFEP